MDYGLQALKLVVGVLILTLTFRVLGKKNLSQLSLFDLVHVIVFGGILEDSLYNDEIGLMPLIFSVAVWAASIFTIEYLARKFGLVRMIFRGAPDYMIEDGKINLKLFSRNNLEMEELRSILRRKDIFSLKDVKDLILEPDGEFSIIQYKEEKPEEEKGEESVNVLLISEGEIQKSALKFIGREEAWLKEEMSHLGENDLSNVTYCEWSEEDGFYYKTRDDCIFEKRKGNIN